MYEIFLVIHSWTRWLVFLGLLYVLARSLVLWVSNSQWTEKDDIFFWSAEQAFGYQVLIGLSLWAGASPITRAAFSEPSLIGSDAAVRFWTVEHGLTMIVALGVLHMGKAIARRKSESQKASVFAMTLVTTFLLMVSAIPWPWLSYGRDFIRWFS